MQPFYELLQVAVGQLDCLSQGPSEEDWQELYVTARRQQLVGICYHGVERLFEYGLRAPHDLSIDWMSDAEQLREEHAKVVRRCQLVQKRLSEKGLRSSVVSGHGIVHCYPAELREQLHPIGVELFVDCDVQRIVRFVELTGQERVGYDAGGAVLLEKWGDTPFKLHHEIAFRTNPLRGGAISQWFRHQSAQLFESAGGLTVPSPTVALVYNLLEMQAALMRGDATMRQLTDIFFLLCGLDGQFSLSADGKPLEAVLRSLGIGRFSRGVMWALQQTLLMDERLMPCSPLASEGRFILSQVMRGRYLWPLLYHHPLLTLCNLSGGSD